MRRHHERVTWDRAPIAPSGKTLAARSHRGRASGPSMKASTTNCQMTCCDFMPTQKECPAQGFPANSHTIPLHRKSHSPPYSCLAVAENRCWGNFLRAHPLTGKGSNRSFLAFTKYYRTVIFGYPIRPRCAHASKWISVRDKNCSRKSGCAHRGPSAGPEDEWVHRYS